MKHLVVALLLLLLPCVVGAAEILVPTDEATIQAAVTASAAGDTVTIEAGTYTEAVDVSGAEDILIRSQDAVADSVIWQPAGTTDDTNNMCILFPFGYTGTLTVQNLTLQGTGTDDHTGIDHTASGDDLALDGVVFDNLRTAIYRQAGGNAYWHFNNITIHNVQAGAPSDGFSYVRCSQLDSMLIENSTFDITDGGDPSWSGMVRLNDVSNATIRNSTFIAGGPSTGDKLDNGFIYLNGSISNVLIEGCSFTGNEDNMHIGLGDTGAADQTEGITIRGCTFSEIGLAAIYARNPTATAANQLHRDLVVYGCDFYSTGGAVENLDSGFGMRLDGVNGGLITGNRFFNFRVYGGITMRSTRHVTVVQNEFYNCDNGISIAGTDVLAAGNQFGCSIVGNWFSGDGDDGSIKVDNYDEGATAAAPNDSSLSIAGNFFSNVTYVGAWVDTSNSQDNEPGVPDWITEMEAESSLMVLQGEGSSSVATDISKFRAAGIVPSRVLGGQGGLTR